MNPTTRPAPRAVKLIGPADHVDREPPEHPSGDPPPPHRTTARAARGRRTMPAPRRRGDAPR